MTVTDTSLDFFLAALFRDYLADATSIAAGVPSNEALPKKIMDAGTLPVYPSLVVTASEEGSRGPRRSVAVRVMILTWSRAGEDLGPQPPAEVAEQTTSAQASAWLAACSARLRDHAALRSWISSLPEARRENFSLIKIVHEGTSSPVRGRETRTVFYPLSMKCHVFQPHA